MAELFESGRIVDLILALLAIEATIVLALRRHAGGGRWLGDLLAYFMSGACLLMALRVALVGGWWGWIGLWLAGAFVVHLVELWRRFRPGRPSEFRCGE